MCLIFVEQGYPQKLFNLEDFPVLGSKYCNAATLSTIAQQGINLTLLYIFPLL